MTVIDLTWADVTDAAGKLARRWQSQRERLTGVYGVPQGGCVPAVMVAHHLGLPVLDGLQADCLIVDDLVDSGRTYERVVGDVAGLGEAVELAFDALYRKPHSPEWAAPAAVELDGWLVLPWENRVVGGPEDAVVRLIEYMGEDPNREGLRDTPARVLRGLAELTGGYRLLPEEILATQFDCEHHGLVTVARMPWESLCEHHVLAFGGLGTVAYLPDPTKGKVVGLSKLARVLDCYARRLQVQERLSTQVADALTAHLDPLGVGVILEATHSCMAGRGIRKSGNMVTEVWRGCMADDLALQEAVRSAHYQTR